MAVCNWCDQEMMGDDTVTCTGNTYVPFPDGMRADSVPYDGERCHDCNIANGGHHHPGCDMERCPRCFGQLIGCGCLDDPEEEDEADL